LKIFDASSIVCLLREANFPKAFKICEDHGYDLSVTKQVYEELEKNPETFKLFKALKGFLVIDNVDAQCISRISKRYPWLHEGEISVLCAGVEKEQSGDSYRCIIDERARNLKSEYCIKVNGTIGLLLWQKEQLNELTSVDCNEIYNRMKYSSFWIKEDVLKELLR
jgi:predicted nucleic acid-binding protein